MTLTYRIKERAYDLGFDLIGLAPAARAPHAAAFERWLAQNYHAGMAWLARDPHRRADPRLVVPGAQAVIVVGMSYFMLNPPPELWHNPARGRIARYAWGRDYHDVLLPRLRELEVFIQKESGRAVTSRAYVDTGPVLERDFAARAGLGFIGKNTVLISPRWGSYLFLAEILVNLDLEYDDPPPPGESTKAGTCGQCTRCLAVCPTHAFPAPYILDSNRCISYLTIEHKGDIPVDLRPLLGNWVFGCDACQEICPWVRRYAHPPNAPFLEFNPDWAIPKLVDLLVLDEAAFRARFNGTPVARAKRRGLLRNVAVALGNWGSPAALPTLEQALQDPEPLIANHAAWAIAQIKNQTGVFCPHPQDHAWDWPLPLPHLWERGRGRGQRGLNIKGGGKMLGLHLGQAGRDAQIRQSLYVFWLVHGIQADHFFRVYHQVQVLFQPVGIKHQVIAQIVQHRIAVAQHVILQSANFAVNFPGGGAARYPL
jgi:epoxyqueuosine reductase